MACKKGFTIVEVMIAVMVFSSVSLLTVMVVMGMARQYQKGAYSVQLNDASRTIHQDIHDSTAYGGALTIGVDNNGKDFICAGRTMYYWQLSANNSITYGLYKKDLGTDSCIAASATGGLNILPKNGFVSEFAVTTFNDIQEIKTRFNVGEADMYQNTVNFSECLPTLRGGDFCSVVNYNSSVMPRI